MGERYLEILDLHHPNDSSSGLLRKDVVLSEASSPTVGKENSNEPRFSLKGLKAVYTPSGGGSSLCPGRHFAKQEVLSTLAILVLQYDIETDVPAE